MLKRRRGVVLAVAGAFCEVAGLHQNAAREGDQGKLANLPTPFKVTLLAGVCDDLRFGGVCLQMKPLQALDACHNL